MVDGFTSVVELKVPEGSAAMTPARAEQFVQEIRAYGSFAVKIMPQGHPRHREVFVYMVR
jgi:hypothetical protein